MRRGLARALVALWLCSNGIAASAQAASSRAHADLAFFERKAQLSKELGATGMLVTEGLPLATWQMDPADPYPMWFVGHAGILTIFPPKDLLLYVNAAYSAEVPNIVRQRCAVLRRYGLKAVWNANEPEVLPEAFFAARPELRGPRIDQPNRSRKAAARNRSAGERGPGRAAVRRSCGEGKPYAVLSGGRDRGAAGE